MYTLKKHGFKFLLMISFLFACWPMAYTQVLYKTFDGFQIGKTTYNTDKTIFDLLQNNPVATEAYNNHLRFKKRAKKWALTGLGAGVIGGSALVLASLGERDINSNLIPIGAGILLTAAGAISLQIGLIYLISSNVQRSNVVKFYNNESIGTIPKTYQELELGLNQNGLSFQLIF